MKKVLGLDLGAASIGWALVDKDAHKILGLGCRIVPYNGTEGQDFAKGTGESRNSLRTKARTARKGYDRYQLRRKYLIDTLIKNGMIPDENLKILQKMRLWELRNKAATENISKQELGRLLLWLNQKRGYKSSRSDANLGKKDTDYVKEVKTRFEKIKTLGLTIGQFFYNELKNNEYFRVKENIFPREAYIEEFDKICAKQKEHLNLTDEFIAEIRNEIIYYQRSLKSQKGLVSACEFEGFWTENNDSKKIFVGPKVAPKSSPLFQIAKIWENVNNIKLSSKQGETAELTLEEKQRIFEHLDSNEKLTVADLFRILNKNKNEFTVTKQIEKGIQGNITKTPIAHILGKNQAYKNLLKLDLNIIKTDESGYLYSKKTGEVLGEKPIKYIDARVENEPFYQLWHTIYSINDIQECSNALEKRFGIDTETADKLAAIDFRKYGFGNKSVKAIRKILPYLMEGDMYSEAMSYAGYNHSNSLTKDENLGRKLLDKLKPIEKNSLRQPIVEKILNQMVNVVNAIIEKYGKPDEIRIELARELKQSKGERNESASLNAANEEVNKEIVKRLSELQFSIKKRNIERYKFIFPIRNCISYDKRTNEYKINRPNLQKAVVTNQCIYCGHSFSFTSAMNSQECDVDHIIPKALLFDDSQNNKVLVHKKCNQQDKSNKTAYDFIRSKGQTALDDYLTRVDEWYKKGLISYPKREKLLVSYEDYLERKSRGKETETDEKLWESFIDRQLRESQYIAKKAREILHTICYNVWSTSGTVTAELRHLWGWDDVTMNLQMPKYKEIGLTEIKEWESEHGKKKHSKEVIKDWTKRDDHRHHAVDALTIACTEQGFIQRFNTLSASKTREDMQREVELRSEQYKDKLSLLEKYIISRRPIDVADIEKAVADILISFKPGKKVAVFGKRKVGNRGNKKVLQTGIIVPRGPLSEDSVYGKIKMIEKNKTLSYLFKNPHLIFQPHIKHLVERRLKKFDNDLKRALTSLKKEPIYLDAEKTKVLEYATCFKDEFVIKYPVNTDFNKTDKVIDGKIKEILQNRLDKFEGKPKEAFKDVQKGEKLLKWYEDEGLERPIHSARCFTGLAAVVPVKKDKSGNAIGFVKTGNNHHIAIYTDKDGNRLEYVCTFWHAVERKKYGIPVVIKNTNEIWNKVLSAKEDTYPQSFLELLPPANLELCLSMQQNEMFVLGIVEEDIKNALENDDYKQISKYLYRVQKLSLKPSSGRIEIVFRHHLETKLVNDTSSKISKRYFNIQSLNALFSLNPFKVKIDCLGNIKP
ncbi:MAG: type II CRISPR RNA-guided endonuclease Cas9 [Prevotellaceae bacterium]|jgi:CRISPR-associated endonuclease Csn1|nr:type II CRISPR RNA-guided endonuclease Cas9 [Prevotellaceae bacterium]